MFDKMFELMVVISAVDRVSGPMLKAMESLGLVQAKAKETQKQLNQFKVMGLIGGAITGIGAGIAYGLVKAADAAGQLQTSMMGVKEALKLTTPEFNKAMDMAQTVGIPTIFSAEDVGGIMQSMATSGLMKNQVLNQSILRDYVNFADVQAQIKKENPSDVVANAVGMAHMFQLYHTSQLTPFLNQLNAALLHTHSSASEFATTFRYIAGQSKVMGMSSEQTLAATAWLDRMGLARGRGGTNFADFLRRTIYGSSGTKADKAMVEAGFVRNGRSIFENANGSFVGIPRAVQLLQNFGNRFHHNAALISPLLNSIFGTQGARIAMMMSSGGAGEQYTRVLNQIGGTATISQAQKQLNNTWQGKIKQLQTTLKDIQQSFGRAVLPNLLPLVKGFDNILARVLKFEQQHPRIMKWVAAFAEIAAAVALVIGPMMILVGIIGYLHEVRAFSAGFRLLGSSIGRVTGLTKLWAGAQWLVNGAMDANPVALIIIGVAALIGIIVLLVMHWRQVVRWIHSAVDWFSHLSLAAKLVITAVFPIVGIPLLIMEYWKPISGFFSRTFRTVIGWIKSAWHWYQNLGDKVKWAVAIFAPFIGIPLLIIDKWKPLETFLNHFWTNTLKPIVDTIGKLTGQGWHAFENFFHIGTGSAAPSKTSLANVRFGSGGSGDVHFHMQPGAVVINASGPGAEQAGRAAYSGMVKQAKASARSRGVRPATSYSR